MYCTFILTRVTLCSLYSGSELFRKSLASGLDVFRAPEYALVTKWHSLDCDSLLLDEDEKASCSAEKIQLTLATSRLQNS